MKNWIKKRPCLSIRCLEREADLPEKTLDHFMAGRRKLNESHIKKLSKVLIKYGWSK